MGLSGLECKMGDEVDLTLVYAAKELSSKSTGVKAGSGECEG